MEVSFELWIHRGLLGPYYLYIVKFSIRPRAVALFFKFVYAILSKFHA